MADAPLAIVECDAVALIAGGAAEAAFALTAAAAAAALAAAALAAAASSALSFFSNSRSCKIKPGFGCDKRNKHEIVQTVRNVCKCCSVQKRCYCNSVDARSWLCQRFTAAEALMVRSLLLCTHVRLLCVPSVCICVY